MRTTVDLDENVLHAAKAIARDERISLGAALSQLARQGLSGGAVRSGPGGFPVFDSGDGAAPIDLEVVNVHRDDP